tara:strand:- start:441 stop:695 length:255 start_codon:yes stop_codon:yes gene_type:complete
MTLIEHLRAIGAVSVEKIAGPNGAFISHTDATGNKGTIPVGGNSQNGTLKEFNILAVADRVDPEVTIHIATINDYSVEETLSLV